MQIAATITGIVPLLVANIAAADPRNPIVKEIVKLRGAKSKKTEEVQEQVNRLHWLAHLYQRNGRVVVPADNILAALQEGAKLSKLGTLLKQAAAFTSEEAYPLEYEGPKDIDALYADGRFVDARMGCLQGRSKVLVVRPVFPAWEVAFDLTWDEEVLDVDQIKKCLVDAGAKRGIGTWRPRFGRFEVTACRISAI